jgi:hypothetical protein
MSPELIDFVIQTFPPPALGLKDLTLGQAPKLIHEPVPVNQESAASLKTAEAMQQLDRAAAPQAEQVFDHGTVHHGDIESL